MGFFANQTIQDACATQAVLNVLFNLDDVKLGDELNNFRSFVTGFDSMMIGETISNSDLIRSVHNSFLTPHPFVDEDKQPQVIMMIKMMGCFILLGMFSKMGKFMN